MIQGHILRVEEGFSPLHAPASTFLVPRYIFPFWPPKPILYLKYKLVPDLNHNTNLTYARFAPVILWSCTKRPMARIKFQIPSHTVPFNRYNL